MNAKTHIFDYTPPPGFLSCIAIKRVFLAQTNSIATVTWTSAILGHLDDSKQQLRSQDFTWTHLHRRFGHPPIVDRNRLQPLHYPADPTLTSTTSLVGRRKDTLSSTTDLFSKNVSGEGFHYQAGSQEKCYEQELSRQHENFWTG